MRGATGRSRAGAVTSDERTYTDKHGNVSTMNTAAIGSGVRDDQIRVPFELQHHYCKALFGETFLEVVYFSLAQLCFE
jgi:hypothetical protein